MLLGKGPAHDMSVFVPSTVLGEETRRLRRVGQGLGWEL